MKHPFLSFAVVCFACTAIPTLRALPAQTASASVYIGKIDTGRVAEVYEAGEALRWTIALRNPSEHRLADARLSWKLSSWASQDGPATPQAAGERDVSLEPGAAASVQLVCTPAALGWFEIVLELRDASGALKERRARSFSVGSTPRSTARHFRYGICSHLGRVMDTPLFDTELELADRLGVDMMRGGVFGWERIQPAADEWDFAKSDRLLASVKERGIDLQPLLAYSPRWASTGDPASKDWNDWNKKAPRLRPWLEYVGAMIGRYSSRAVHWEIWNEPDISFWRSPTSEYIALFNATAALIKEKSPGVRVINGGLAMIPRPPNMDFVDRFVADAAQKNWDVFAYHDYHTFAQFLERREEVLRLKPRLREGMPIWINEGGFQTLLAGGERRQAQVLVKKMATSPALGIGAYFWYDLRDDGLEPKEPEHHFGLTRHDGQPKPAWSAYQALIRELGAARYVRSMPARDIPAGVWAHLYELPEPASPEGANHVLVLWREGASRETPSWLGTGAEGRVTSVTDIMGNPVDVVLAKDGAAFRLTDDPVYVHIRSTARELPALQLKPLLETAPIAIVIPGRRTQVGTQVNNPFDHAITATLDWSSNIPGLTLSDRTESLQLDAGGRLDSKTTLLLPEGDNAKVDDPHINLLLSIPASELRLPARIPVSLALPVARLSAAVPDLAIPQDIDSIKLIRGEDVHNLYSAEPLPEMHWSGPRDLACNARIACDAIGLRMVMEVADDIHIQSDVREGLWSADSLQVGLRLNETDSGYIEIGLALDNDGKTGGWVYSTLPSIPLARGKLGTPIRYAVSRSKEAAITTYRLHLPWSELGAKGPPAGGFRLNFIANDSDGKGRKQWVQLGDGLGDQKSPDLWRVFSCQ